MNDIDMPRVSSSWLGLRESADAAARAVDLVELVGARLTGEPLVIHDFGCGTGSMGRWLAPRLPGPQHWIMYDRDPDLLEWVAADLTIHTIHAADGTPVTVETRQRDITELTAADLDGASLVTASALLDLLTMDDVERVAAACVGAGCPVLLTISVVGRVELTPADPLDSEIAAAFNAHQRRAVGGRRLLGPDAVDAILDAFGRLGAVTQARPSPWRLGAGHPGGAGLLSEWFEGWWDAASEQRPELAERAALYRDRRLAQVADGQLGAVVHHADLLAYRE